VIFFYISNIYITHNHIANQSYLQSQNFGRGSPYFFHKEYGVAYIHGLRNIKINKKNKYYFHFKFLNLHLYFIIYKVKEKNGSNHLNAQNILQYSWWFSTCQLSDRLVINVLELIIETRSGANFSFSLFHFVTTLKYHCRLTTMTFQSLYMKI
jgi:hypothetical protein